MIKYIAAVVRADGQPSRKADGSYAAFISEDRDEAVTQALRAAAQWSQGIRSYGTVTTYAVEVGQLTHTATTKPDYVLRVIDSGKPVISDAEARAPRFDGPEDDF